MGSGGVTGGGAGGAGGGCGGRGVTSKPQPFSVLCITSLLIMLRARTRTWLWPWPEGRPGGRKFFGGGGVGRDGTLTSSSWGVDVLGLPLVENTALLQDQQQQQEQE